MAKIWIVGQVDPDESPNSWAMHGAFDTEAAAVKVCIAPNYFVGPLTVNEPFPHEPCEWPGAYYPVPFDG